MEALAGAPSFTLVWRLSSNTDLQSSESTEGREVWRRRKLHVEWCGLERSRLEAGLGALLTGTVALLAKPVARLSRTLAAVWLCRLLFTSCAEQ